jgi:hypothetical protein
MRWGHVLLAVQDAYAAVQQQQAVQHAALLAWLRLLCQHVAPHWQRPPLLLGNSRAACRQGCCQIRLSKSSLPYASKLQCMWSCCSVHMQ